MIGLRGAQDIRRIPPVDIADEVQLWAREQGRRFGRMEWHPMMQTWVIHFGRRSDDPVLRAYQEGQLAEEPTESVFLNEWDRSSRSYRALPLEEYGAAGIRQMLNEANMWSGTGMYNSLQESINAVRARNQRNRENLRAKIREAGQEMDWLYGRTLRGTPVITPGIELKERN